LFFSATMAPEIERITNTFLSNPARIEVARQASASETIEQGVVMFKGSRKDREASEKRKVLRMLIDAEGDKCTNASIFCNRKTDVDIVAKSLNKYGYDAAPIHGDLDQSQRTRTLDGFRANKLRFLVASDVAARGLDVPSVSHVFNFDVPSHAEDYVHRIGRTGRAGRDGKAMMICVPRDEKNFEDIERLIQREIPRLENPLGHIGAEAQGDAPAAETTEKKPSRSRSRSRSRKSDDAPQVDARAENTEAKPDAAPKPVEAKQARAEKPADTQANKAPDSRTADQRNDTRADNRSDNRNDNSDSKRNASSRSRGGRDDRGGNRVTGLGDHTPTFIEKSFAERYDG
jgi:superfamily II DNA/RNA helicase